VIHTFDFSPKYPELTITRFLCDLLTDLFPNYAKIVMHFTLIKSVQTYQIHFISSPIILIFNIHILVSSGYLEKLTKLDSMPIFSCTLKVASIISIFCFVCTYHFDLVSFKSIYMLVSCCFIIFSYAHSLFSKYFWFYLSDFHIGMYFVFVFSFLVILLTIYNIS